VDPNSPLATAAAEPAAADVAVAAALDPTVSAADGAVPGHHHHHHRHLMQAGGNAEWGSPWVVSRPPCRALHMCACACA
jgi:hypothetical protein